MNDVKIYTTGNSSIENNGCDAISLSFISVVVSFSQDLCPEGFLSKTRSVGTGYELRMHRTHGKLSIINHVHSL